MRHYSQIETSIKRGLETRNPIVEALEEIHKRVGVDYKIFKVPDRHQVRVPIVFSSSPSFICTNEDLSRRIEQYKQFEVTMHRLCCPFLITREVTTTIPADNIAKDIIGRLKYSLREAHLPVSYDNLPYSIICMGSVIMEPEYEMDATKIYFTIGVLLSTELHKKIVGKICKNCSQRLKCVLIPSKQCELSFLVNGLQNGVNT